MLKIKSMYSRFYTIYIYIYLYCNIQTKYMYATLVSLITVHSYTNTTYMNYNNVNLLRKLEVRKFSCIYTKERLKPPCITANIFRTRQ